MSLMMKELKERMEYEGDAGYQGRKCNAWAAQAKQRGRKSRGMKNIKRGAKGLKTLFLSKDLRIPETWSLQEGTKGGKEGEGEGCKGRLKPAVRVVVLIEGQMDGRSARGLRGGTSKNWVRKAYDSQKKRRQRKSGLHAHFLWVPPGRTCWHRKGVTTGKRE